MPEAVKTRDNGPHTPAPNTPGNGSESDGQHQRHSFPALILGSIGVVYGDIGTSPLYAFREAVLAASGIPHNAVATSAVSSSVVLEVISLILWALIFIVTIKYVLLLLRADNKGEGGILSLMALAQRGLKYGRYVMPFLGMMGAALFYSDSIITPAISVLSAIEGLKLITPALDPFVEPITVIILIALFAVQSHGTARVANFFGPITLIWFVVMGVLGLMHISDHPDILLAFNPVYGLNFLLASQQTAFLTLGAVFLAVTGAEALYADLGHFGRKPIQFAWIFLVLPALALNYLGQGALVLSNPAALENPFYLLAPSWALVPLVILATAATVIASQAVITGAYSMTRQAIQLGLFPRLTIHHTSEKHSGQIFIPRTNFVMLIGVILLVLLFDTSSNLAAMYGIAVTGDMLITSLMFFFVLAVNWRLGYVLAALIIIPLLIVEGTFLAANLMKVLEGGWVPILVGSYLILLMLTWRAGSKALFEKTRRSEVPLKDLVRSLEKGSPHEVPGTAVFLTSDPDSAPTALLHNLKHNKVLHEKNVILTIITSDVPRVPDEERVRIEPVSDRSLKVAMTFGFMETPNAPKGLALARKLGWSFDIMSTSFFLSRRTLKSAANPALPMWQEKIFLSLAKGADNATDYFHIPTTRVVEVGTQVLI